MIQNVYYKKIYKFKWKFFFIRSIFFFLIEKNTIENSIFLTIICERRKKRKFSKFFVSIRPANFV